MNLLNNAAKYSEPGGRIEVVVTTEEAHLIISVGGTGIGIAGGQLAEIFDVFSQVDRSIERSFDLHLVKPVHPAERLRLLSAPPDRA